MIRLAIIALLALPVAGASAQSGDPAVGSRLGSRTQAGKSNNSADDAIKASYRHAQCIYFSRDRTVKRWLTTADPQEYQNAAREVFKLVECDSMAFADPWVDNISISNGNAGNRGMLAEMALRKEGKLTPKAGPLPALPLEEGYNRSWFAMTSRTGSLDAMAICFAETQPQLVFDLLRTEPTSVQEKTVIGQVADKIGTCLIGGAQLRANAYLLRTALAEAYFHRIYGPAANAGPAGNVK